MGQGHLPYCSAAGIPQLISAAAAAISVARRAGRGEGQVLSVTPNSCWKPETSGAAEAAESLLPKSTLP